MLNVHDSHAQKHQNRKTRNKEEDTTKALSEACERMNILAWF